jgi:hypothetical protein
MVFAGKISQSKWCNLSKASCWGSKHRLYVVIQSHNHTMNYGSKIHVRVGTLKDGYVRNVPLPRVPQRQSASHMTSHELIAPKAGISIPGYLHVPNWIPTLPKLGSLIGFSQRLLWPFSPIAIKAKNNLLSSAHGIAESLEQSTVLSEQKKNRPL